MFTVQSSKQSNGILSKYSYLESLCVIQDARGINQKINPEYRVQMSRFKVPSMHLQTQLQQLLFLMFLIHVVYCGINTCSSGLEYDCKSLRGNGTGCVSDCNSTITKRLSPGYCTYDCCKLCYFDCQECLYVKILSFCIHGSNSSWTDHLLDKKSKQHEILDHDVKTALLDALQSENQSFLRTELLQVKWYSKSSQIIQVYVKVTSRIKSKETLAINGIRNQTKSGQLGALTVLPHMFEIITEQDYAMLKNNKGQEEKLDVVELIAACVGAFIILAAVYWCLFYMCTTPHQRNRCNPCHENRVNA